jgi:hypothetical protein
MDGKLGRMDSHRQAARAGGSIISKQGALAPLIQFSRASQNQRTSRDNQPALQQMVKPGI